MYSSVVISSPSRFSSTLSQSLFLRPCPRAIVICYDAPLMYSLFLLRPLPVCRLSFSHVRYIPRRFISFWHTLSLPFLFHFFFLLFVSPLLSIFSVSFLFSLFFLFSFVLSLFFLPLFFLSFFSFFRFSFLFPLLLFLSFLFFLPLLFSFFLSLFLLSLCFPSPLFSLASPLFLLLPVLLVHVVCESIHCLKKKKTRMEIIFL